MSNLQEIVKLFLKLIIWWYDNEKPVDNIILPTLRGQSLKTDAPSGRRLSSALGA